MTSVPPETGSSPLPQDESAPPQRNTHRIFIGSNGIRAGWRLALAIAIFLALLTAISGAITLVPRAHEWAFGRGPVGLFFSEGM
ncbi:MAG TPA: hypothetical protein VGJ04_03420, partial [Pirellulales bacterium]